MLPSLPEAGTTLLNRVSEVVNTAGIGLSIPAIFTDCNNLRHSIANLFTVQDLPYSDPLRSRKITQAVKQGFLDGMALTNDTTQAALFAERVQLLPLEPNQLRTVDGVYNGTSVILDGAELVGEYYKLKSYHSPETQPRNEAEIAKLEEKKTLSWMIIVKDIASIGGSAIALVGILFGVATASIPILVTGGLLLSTTWLTMKLFSYFYNKIVVEAPVEAPVRAGIALS
jgi:hypothetical protein